MNNRSKLAATAIATIFGACFAGEALAAISPSISKTTDKIEQRFERQKEAKAAKGAKIEAGQEAKAQAGKGMEKIRFVLKQVQFEGNTVVGSDVLAGFLKNSMGKEISLADLSAAADEITAYYRNQGYILSRAVVPQQKIKKDGVVKITIIEGYVQNVVIQGDVAGSPQLVQAYAEKIKASRPLDSKVLERYLLLADDLPGVTARGVLKPSSATGAADLVIEVSHKKVSGSLSEDNRGSKFIGPYQTTASVDLNSVLGLYERTALRGIVASPVDELKFFDIVHEEQIGSEGTRIIGTASYTDAEPGFTLKPFDIKSKNYSFGLRVEHPFIRTRNQNLTAMAGYEYRQTEAKSFGTEISQDHINAASIGGSYDFADSGGGVSLFNAKVDQGLTNEDSVNASRANGEGQFTKISGDVSHTRPIWGKFAGVASARGQWSADPLLASEEFDLGGEKFGRAYDPSELSGDNGAAFKAELNYGEQLDYKYLNSYQFYGYYDVGAVWNKEVLPGEKSKESLASTGIGARFNVTDYFSGYTEVAFPLTKRVGTQGADDGHDPRFFFNLTARF